MNKLIIFAITILLVNSQSDGNPHKWDRLRRCDQTDYSPTCGMCEGIGGIPTSDKNEDIKLTYCKEIATPDQVDPKTIRFPEFPLVFTNTGFYETLINQKKNPFCVGGFPGADSTGDHCYQNQEGTFYYDWNQYSLYIKYNSQGALINSTTDLYHTKGDMWTVVKQFNLINLCVCLNPGKAFNIEIYPINPYFMKNGSTFLGRIELGIEFLNQIRVVDHWVKGPHHLFVDVETGHIIRQYQPWNGLEVWDPSKWTYTVPENQFVTPPNSCKKGGFWFRIKCLDDGTPQDHQDNIQDEFLSY